MNQNVAEHYPCTERVHKAFRGSTEQAKWLRVASLFSEAVAAFVAGIRIVKPEMSWPGWASLALALVVISGITLHVWAKFVVAFSERCRRVAVRAYSKGVDITQAASTSLVADAPYFATLLADKLPTKTLADYYECKCPPGAARVREIYSHSAFYTWRLQRINARICFASAVFFALAGFLVIYGLAAAPINPTISSRILDLVCSIFFVFLTARAATAAVEIRQSYIECRKICEAFMAQGTNDDPSDLAAEYDVEMSAGNTIPTLLYKFKRDELQKEWQGLRTEIKDAC